MNNSPYTTLLFADLFLSEENMRKAKVDKNTDKETKSSIAAVWLLQNLVVGQKTDKGYPVEAGGRRYRFVGELIEEGIIPADKPIPVRILQEGENAKEVSLMENRMRAPSHPVDECEAFHYMITVDGLTVADLSKRFSQSQKYIKQRLLLGNVCESLRNLCREGKFDLDILEAFTVCDDHEKQVAAYNQYKGSWNLSARNIRSFLLDEKIKTTDKFVKFVTLAKYKNAGGTTTSDLFENATYINDASLLRELVNEKIATETEQREKEWSWVEYSDYIDSSQLRQFDQIEREHKKEPTALLKKLAAKRAELQTLEDQGEEENWPDELSDQCDELENAINALEEEIDAKKTFVKGEKPFAGCLVTLNEQGEVVTYEGLVKKGDKTALQTFREEGKGGVAPSADTATGDDQDDEPLILSDDAPTYTQALQTDLHIIRHSIAKAAILKDIELGADLLAFSQCYDVFNDTYHSSPLKTSITNSYEDSSQEDIQESRANQEMNAYLEQIDTSWLKDDVLGSFEAYRALPAKVKKKLATYCAAYSLCRYSIDAEPSLLAYLLDTTDTATAEYYRPTASSFFKRVKGNHLNDQAVSLMGEAWVNEHIHQGQQKRAWIVEQLEAAVTGQLDDQPHIDVEHVRQWLPLGFFE